jgi:hypothetical protein
MKGAAHERNTTHMEASPTNPQGRPRRGMDLRRNPDRPGHRPPPHGGHGTQWRCATWTAPGS